MKYIAIVLTLLVLTVPFIMAQEITFEEYSKNPVFDSAPKAYYPTVIFDINKFSGHGDASYYKMWYSNGNGGAYVTQSEDGINWTNIITNTGLTSPHHCHVVYFPNGFSGANSGINPSSTTMYYRIWYQDTSAYLYSINSIRCAESSNGINWYNDQTIQQVGNSVVGSNDWNRGSYGPIDVFYNVNGSTNLDDVNIWNNKFVMYYDGTTGSFEEIGLAYSTDGILWKGYGRVLKRGNEGVWGNTDAWDSSYTTYGTVVKIGDTWHLWYSGGQTEAGEGIGHATSTDGINWQRDPNNPILYKNDGVLWRNDRTYTPSVLYDPNGFETGGCPNLKMWFTGKTGSNYTIGYANTCVKIQTTNKVTPNLLYNIQLTDLFSPSSNIHYIPGGQFTSGLLINNNLENIIQIGVENRGLLKAKDVTLAVEDCPSCMKINIRPEKTDILPKSTYYYDVSINPNCDPGNYKIKFKVQGTYIYQEKEIEISVK